jgi:hypothetical protein
MMDDRRKNVRRCGRRIDAPEIRGERLDRGLMRVSIVRRSSDPAADMGDWIIDEVDC